MLLTTQLCLKFHLHWDSLSTQLSSRVNWSKLSFDFSNIHLEVMFSFPAHQTHSITCMLGITVVDIGMLLKNPYRLKNAINRLSVHFLQRTFARFVGLILPTRTDIFPTMKKIRITFSLLDYYLDLYHPQNLSIPPKALNIILFRKKLPLHIHSSNSIIISQPPYPMLIKTLNKH